MRSERVYTVSQVNTYIKDLLDGDGALNGIYIRGELSNYKMYPSGHHYFSLKDESGSIRCVMFRREAGMLRFRPENGMKIIAFGRVTVFPRDGQYQLYVDAMTSDGVGDLHVAFEQLKAKLYNEGLFAPEHKQPLPRFPGRIALVTSSAGAAVRDMLRILKARWPMAEVCVVPVRVQGSEAAGEIAGAIRWVNEHALAELIITGRGGGSMEDLWAFNEEIVARAIYASEIPVISAVGHEPDVTISDFVADLRAATPSNAAELAVPDQAEVRDRLRQLSIRMEQALSGRIHTLQGRLEQISRRKALQDPMAGIRDRRVLVDYQRTRLASALERKIGTSRERFTHMAATLDAISPLKVLSRGYAIAKTQQGHLIRRIGEVNPGDAIRLRVSDGEIHCIVSEQAPEAAEKGVYHGKERVEF